MNQANATHRAPSFSPAIIYPMLDWFIPARLKENNEV